MSIVGRAVKKVRKAKQVIDDAVAAFSGEVYRKADKPAELPLGHRDARVEEWQLVTHIKLALAHLDESSIKDAKETLQTALKQTGHEDEGPREEL